MSTTIAVALTAEQRRAIIRHIEQPYWEWSSATNRDAAAAAELLREWTDVPDEEDN